MELSTQNADNLQIRRIVGIEIPELLESLPYDCGHSERFTQEDGGWRLVFECCSVTSRFFASTLGQTPQEAFAAAKEMIALQIREWHNKRFYVPRVLIVDDDVDVAMAMQKALSNLGWQTDVAYKHEDLHRRIIASDADYILLDWRLNDSVTADRVMEKTLRLITAFSDLRHKFRKTRPGIVTYSGLDRREICLPAGGHEYFNHLDHWQKPMSFTDIVARATNLATLV